MRRNIKLFFAAIFIIFSMGNNIILADDYPKSQQEQKWDEVGSIAGEEGLVFRPGRVKNESTKVAGCSINRYL